MSETPTPGGRKLLVLGTSGTNGAGMGPNDRVWPEIVRDGLAAQVGETELALRRFYVHLGRPMEFLERELKREQWDYIVVQCTSFPATQKTVAHRVRNILGKRAGEWTEARVRTVDVKTRRKGRLRHQVNRTGHRIARRTIGTSPMVGLDELIDGYLRAIDRISMEETASIVVVGTGLASAASRRNNPEVERIKARFDGEISAAAKRKHLGWVESAAVTREADDPEATFLDMLHKGQDWHNGIAKRVLALLAER